MGRQDDKEVLTSRPTLINEVLALYSRAMLLIKHRRTFPEDDPTVNTLDGIEQAGLATLPNFRKTALTIAASLSWLPSFICNSTLYAQERNRLRGISCLWKSCVFDTLKTADLRADASRC